MVRTSHLCCALTAALTLGCGHSHPEGPKAIALEPVVAAQAWFGAGTACGQGPYVLELPVTDAKWGEEVELRIATPRRIALRAEVLADDAEVAHGQGVYDSAGAAAGAADNGRCVADVHERLAASRGGTPPSGGGGGGRVGEVTAPPVSAPPSAPITLVEESPPGGRTGEVVRFAWDGHGHAHVRVRLWSVEPNDLTDVRFGIARVEWRPNVSEAEYEAFLARQAAEAQAEARRAAAAAVTVHVAAETDAERRAREAREERDRIEARAHAEAAAQALLEDERRAKIAAALAAQAAAERERFCASHAEDRDCWGAGGRKVHDELARHDGERAQFCATAPEDARCWSDETRRQRTASFQARVTAALAPPKEPDGPPPAPLAEETPPRLSLHAEWRPGYWQWTGAQWTWLGGMWRVPDSDIAAELTTTAPAAPPPLRVEVVAAPPMRALIWVPGFWQWGGAAWVWVAGSWQRPEAGARWQPAEWRARGAVHVLIPGRWVRS